MEPQSATHSALKALIVLVAVALIAGGVWYSVKSRSGGTASEAPALSDAERLGTVSVSGNTQAALARHKQEILAKVASGAAFSDEEKQSVSRLMLSEAHLYGFSEEERTAIFTALRSR